MTGRAVGSASQSQVELKKSQALSEANGLRMTNLRKRVVRNLALNRFSALEDSSSPSASAENDVIPAQVGIHWTDHDNDL